LSYCCRIPIALCSSARYQHYEEEASSVRLELAGSRLHHQFPNPDAIVKSRVANNILGDCENQ
jgi:hypothetical protein